jgi:hypothetical protein
MPGKSTHRRDNLDGSGKEFEPGSRPHHKARLGSTRAISGVESDDGEAWE